MEPTRLLVAVEIEPSEAEEFYTALNQFFMTKASNVRYSVKVVKLVDENGQKDEKAPKKVV